jgi:hypothetical protein
MSQLCIPQQSRVKAAIALLAMTAYYLFIAAGCASLPDARLYLDGRNAAPVQVEGARGLLSAQQSAGILNQLKRKSGDIDILEKHAAIEQAIVGSPVTAGNKVVLLHAEKQVHLTIAYFVPDPQFLQIVMDAAKRGVDVKLILPSVSDSGLVFHAGRSHYSELLAAGVKIYERGGSVLHSKTVCIDGVWSSIGSTNLDWRSFLHNDEINAVVLGHEFAQQLEAVFAQDLAASTAINAEEWERRPFRFRFRERAARVWEYWL